VDPEAVDETWDVRCSTTWVNRYWTMIERMLHEYEDDLSGPGDVRRVGVLNSGPFTLERTGGRVSLSMEDLFRVYRDVAGTAPSCATSSPGALDPSMRTYFRKTASNACSVAAVSQPTAVSPSNTTRRSAGASPTGSPNQHHNACDDHGHAGTAP
jgi:hypothetical protein